MFFPLFKNIGRIEKVFILVCLIVVGLILGSLIPILIISAFPSLSQLNELRIMQIISQIFTFIIPPILFSLLVNEKPFKSLGFNKIPLWSLVGILMMYAIIPLNYVFAEWNANIKLPESMSSIEEMIRMLSEKAAAVTEMMLMIDNTGGLIINLFMIAGLAAFGEELIFRSILQPFIIKSCKNVHLGIFITAFVFSFIHFEFYGFIPRLILGLLLGYMFFFSGSIWVPMIMHFVNNGTAVVLYYLNCKKITNIDVESFGKTEILPLIASILIMIALLWYVIKHYKTEKLSGKSE